MTIDHNSPVPLHFQVEQMLREMLKEKKYQDGELLPPEALMAEKLAVSRNTVRAAISRMVHEGLLERKAGLGTRHVKQAIKTNLKGWPSFTQEMKNKGVKVEVFSLNSELVIAEEEVADILRLTEAQRNQNIVKMSRTRGYSGVPSVHAISWFHPRTKITADADFSKPLYEILGENSGVTVVYSKEEISAMVADEELSEKLVCGVGSPILKRVRVVTTASKKEVEYNVNFYRADRFTYGLTIQAS